MTQPSIIFGSGARDRPTVARPTDAEWAILGAAGLSFFVLGLLDQALVWYPSAFGSPEWEFGAVTSMMNALPVTALGAMLLVAAGVARRRPIVARLGAGALALLALFVLCAALLYATTVPMALNQVTNELVRGGLMKAIAKTLVQSFVYAMLLLWVSFTGWRAVRTQ
jgi:hypothetical protein